MPRKFLTQIEIENLMKDLEEENFDDSDSENEDEFENNEVDFDQKVESLFAWKKVEGSEVIHVLPFSSKVGFKVDASNFKSENAFFKLLFTNAILEVLVAETNGKISNKQIKPTNIVFKTYKGDSIIPLGYVTVRVQYKNQKVNLNLYIVKENLDTILGREWLYKIHLDWPAIKAFRAKTEQNLNNLLREYKDIFDDKLGEINNYEAKLKLRHGVKPIFCRVRTVPFALKGRVENEIDRLEKEGIIEKVDSSEWATPVVPVVKSDGSIRLCADYSVTLNPNLIVPQHPLPRLDEIFGSLNGENNLQN
ncbi:retrovirus-related Pol polyprotein from transposon 412 [Trichonephila clavipes]|nr:retrovirus-related Pol polyprotein from transposon 412 [Trichonephila clavipes]